MIYTRTILFICILSICLTVLPVRVSADISLDIQQKIQKLRSLPSISTLFTPFTAKQSVATTSTSTLQVPPVFTRGMCPQPVRLMQDSTYLLQVINPTTGLPAAYIPKNLVEISTHIQTASSTSVCLVRDAAEQLYFMSEDMKAQGLDLVAISGYRSFIGQQDLFKRLAPSMNKGPHMRVAPAGYSEHQLGTAIDVASRVLSGPEFAFSKESAWIQEHAHTYGFVVSYEQGHEHKTGYMHEPWHLRYVGVSNATVLKKGEYSLAYKNIYYKEFFINNLLGRLKDYVDMQMRTYDGIGG